MNDFRCNYDIVMNSPTRYKRHLIRLYELGHEMTNSVGNGLGYWFVRDIAKTIQSELVDVLWPCTLGLKINKDE